MGSQAQGAPWAPCCGGLGPPYGAPQRRWIPIQSTYLAAMAVAPAGGKLAVGPVEGCSLRVTLCQIEEPPGGRPKPYRPAQ
ncbi:MAG: hypothetical protein Kow0096_25760 [Thiohalomonadaceae bacterium]